MTRRSPAQYNWDKLLFDETIMTKHFTKKTSRDIDFVVVHHMVIQDKDLLDDEALDACYKIWQVRAASAHYGVEELFVRQFVWDTNMAWATGTALGNEKGISIEHVNKLLNVTGTINDYTISERTWKNGAKLAAYLHKVHKLGRPVKNKTLRKHSSFKATACPGPYMDKIWDQYVAEAQRVYDLITKPVVAVPMTRGRHIDHALADLAAAKAATNYAPRLAVLNTAITALKSLRQYPK
jgi:hypothetical protein